jgi:hypothetical protein
MGHIIFRHELKHLNLNVMTGESDERVPLASQVTLVGGLLQTQLSRFISACIIA